MKILILGGTGAMGTHLVDLFSQQGHKVTVTSRSRNDTTGNVHYVKGDAHDIFFLKSILKKNQWSAIIDFMVYSTPVFEARARSLLDATDQYIFLSSSRVYAQSINPLTEDSPRLLDVSTDKTYLATDEYALTKARQENILFDSIRSNWTIIRPYITFGSQRLQLGVLEKEDWLYRALNNRTIVFSNEISDRFTTITYGKDVAKGILSLIGKPLALGEAFHITSQTSLRWSDVLNTYLDTLQERTSIRPRVLLTDLRTFTKSHPATYQINYDRLYDRIFDCKKVNDFIDTSQFSDPLNSLRSSLKSFLDAPKFKHINARYEALKDFETNEFTPLSQLSGMMQKIRYISTRHIKTKLI